jgi:hypothetical protein
VNNDIISKIFLNVCVRVLVDIFSTESRINKITFSLQRYFGEGGVLYLGEDLIEALMVINSELDCAPNCYPFSPIEL